MSAPINVSPTDLRGAGNTVSAAMTGAAVAQMPPLNTGADMPQPGREFSTMIVGGVWPVTSTNGLRQAAAEHRAAAADHEAAFDHIQRTADQLGATNSGAAIDAAVQSHYGRAYQMRDLATDFYNTATMLTEHAEHIDTATAALDQIDQQANTRVQQIRSNAEGADATARMAAHNEMLSVLSGARADTESTATAADAAIAASGVTQDLRGAPEPAPKPKPAAGIRGPNEPLTPVPASAPLSAPTGVSHTVTETVPKMGMPAAHAPIPVPPAAAGARVPQPIPAALKGFDTALTSARYTPPITPAASPTTPPAPSSAAGLAVTAAPPTVTAAGPTPTPTQVASGAPVPPTPATPPVASAGPARELPPFGYDRPTFTGAPIPPAAGPSAAAPALSPPTVLPSALPAAGGAAVAASLLPDRHLMNALHLINELQRASREYACIDWCVGVFITGRGPVLVATSNEGASYIPHGVFLPVGVRLLWADPVINAAFTAEFFGRANPAETMIGYAGMVGCELAALAVSTNDGGSAAPAAAVHEYAETSLDGADENPPLDDVPRLHRLAVIDPLEYTRITTVDMQPGESGLRLATGTLIAGLPDLPPIITTISDVLTARTDVADDDWDELADTAATARFTAALHRPGRIGHPDPDGYRAAFTTARAAELLTHWRTPEYADIAYTLQQLGGTHG